MVCIILYRNTTHGYKIFTDPQNTKNKNVITQTECKENHIWYASLRTTNPVQSTTSEIQGLFYPLCSFELFFSDFFLTESKINNCYPNTLAPLSTPYDILIYSSSVFLQKGVLCTGMKNLKDNKIRYIEDTFTWRQT